MTEAQVVSLTAELRSLKIEHRVYEAPLGNWNVQATSGTLYTAAQLQNLEAAHGITARTNRAEFS